MKSLRYNAKTNRVTINSITPELEKLVKSNNLDFDYKYNIVKLTPNNAKKIEKLVEEDDSYFLFTKHLCDHFGLEKIKKNENRCLIGIIREIDRDNSTNVWRYKESRALIYKIRDYILDPKNNFFEELERGNPELPDKIFEYCGKRGVKSLSSKVCMNMCKYIFNKDNYYINDSFIRYALPYYLDYYKVDRTLKDGKVIKTCNDVDKLSYKDLFYLLDKLNNKRLARYELDHIIWYCYKSFK